MPGMISNIVAFSQSKTISVQIPASKHLTLSAPVCWDSSLGPTAVSSATCFACQRNSWTSVLHSPWVKSILPPSPYWSCTGSEVRSLTKSGLPLVIFARDCIRQPTTTELLFVTVTASTSELRTAISIGLNSRLSYLFTGPFSRIKKARISVNPLLTARWSGVCSFSSIWNNTRRLFFTMAWIVCTFFCLIAENRGLDSGSEKGLKFIARTWVEGGYLFQFEIVQN